MQTDFNEVTLTLVLDELVEEAGLPRAGAANHQELKQEVCRQRKGKEGEINATSTSGEDLKLPPFTLPSRDVLSNPIELQLAPYPTTPI